MNRYLRYIVVCCLTCFSVAAQNTCEDRVKEAESLYNNGNFAECIRVADKVIRECRLSKKEREAVFEMMAKAQVESDDQEGAEKTIRRLLENSPYYEIKNEAAEPEDYVRTFKKFQVHPLWSIGVKNAVMHPQFAAVKSQHGANVTDNATYSTYNKGWYLNYYGWLEFQPFQNISFNAECIYYNIWYYREVEKPSSWLVNYSENLTFAELPFYVKRTFTRQNLLYSVSTGFSWQRLTNAYSNVSIYDYRTDSTFYNYNINRTAERNKNNFQWLIGCNIGYKFNNLRIFLDLRYFAGLTNLVNPSVPPNQLLADYYYYVDKGFKFSKAVEIGASAIYVIKSSIKKKK
jgi:hypothetical protein